MQDNPILEKFQPEDIRSPYWGFPVLIGIIWMALIFISQGYSQVPLVTYVLFSIIGIGAIFFSTYQVSELYKIDYIYLIEVL